MSKAAFPRLTHLTLSGNFLVSLPAVLQHLGPTLQSLCIEKTWMVGLHSCIGCLTHLTQLVLADNCINALPEEAAALTSLRVLNLHCNALASLPNWLSSLVGLERLDVSYNVLRGLDSSLAALTGLKSLNASHNCEFSWSCQELSGVVADVGGCVVSTQMMDVRIVGR